MARRSPIVWIRKRIIALARQESNDGLMQQAREYLATAPQARDLWPGEGGAIDLQPFPTGRNTLTAAWDHPRHGPLVVRVWHAHYDHNSPGQHAEGARLLGEAGLKVPRVLLCDGSFATARRRGIAILVEERAAGTHGKRREAPRPGLAAALGDQIGRLHARRGEVWGTPWQADNEMRLPARYFARQIALNAERAVGALKVLDGAKLGAIADSLARDVAAFPFAAPRLVHGDFFSGNIIQAADGTATWIDFETVHYGLAGTDLVSARRWLGPHGEFDAFAQAWESRTGLRMDDFADECLLAARLTLLHKLAARVRRLKSISPENRRRGRLMGEQRSYEEGLLMLHERRDARMLSDVAFPGSIGSTMEP